MNPTHENFREEVLTPFFKHVKSGESFYILGAPSAGKTRLMDFILGEDPDVLRENPDIKRNWIREKYLGKELTSTTWFVRVDMNRMRQEYDWGFGFFELMLNSTLLACNRVDQTESVDKIRNRLASLDSQVMEGKDALTAHRLFEIAVHALCHVHGIRLCFLFDEFDVTYQSMPADAFNQLRAVRDANKHLLFYALSLRNLPEKLRDPNQNENFYELISRNLVGIGPFSAADTYRVIEQLEKRHDFKLSPEQREWMRETSGGHPGLIQALLSLLKDNPSAAARLRDLEWFARQEVVREEFRKFWGGLLKDEQDGLTQVAHGDRNGVLPSTGKLLLAKGLVKPLKDGVVLFTPLFDIWLK